jgi:REP element-mobilizing transposase RayT
MAHQLNHETPLHIDASEHHFYITQCALPRGEGVLIHMADELVSSIQYYHEIGRWSCRAYVVMPDHIHLLIVPSSGESTSNLMRSWKSYIARKFSILWQKDFFETRLRSEESPTEKARYIELNPTRAGLVTEVSEWKWFGYCGE